MGIGRTEGFVGNGTNAVVDDDDDDAAIEFIASGL
jgi:hypothetical protein